MIGAVGLIFLDIGQRSSVGIPMITTLNLSSNRFNEIYAMSFHPIL